MKKTLNALALIASFLIAFEANARLNTANTCDNSYNHYHMEDLEVNTTITIPDSAPLGSIVWRMPEKKLSYSCNRGDKGFSTYIFFNPYNENFNSDIEVGVTYDGKDYVASDTKKIRGDYVDDKFCGSNQICVNSLYSYTMSIFIVKKSNKAKTVNIDNYIAYNIGMDATSATDKLSIRIKGLHANLLPCTSMVTITPNTIDFGEISNTGATPELEIKRENFTLSEQRECQSPSTYGLNGILSPTSNARLFDNLSTLVPNDNDSVGISIFDAESSTQIRFNKEFIVIPKIGTTSNSKDFEARLKWRTKTPKIGKFNAGAILDVYYK